MSATAQPLSVTCEDGKTFGASEARCVASVTTAKGRDARRPPVVGEFPVLVEQSGDYRMFTYSSRIAAIDA